MSKNKQRLMLFFMLIIYVAIALGGLAIAYVIKNTFLTAKPTASKHAQKQMAKPIPTPKGWKTYHNSEYKISFSYPPADRIKTSTYGLGITSLQLQHVQNKNTTIDFQLLLLPKTLAQAVGQDFTFYYALPNHATKIIKNPLVGESTTEKFTKIRNRTIAGNQALDYQAIPSNAKPGTPVEIGAFVAFGGNLLLISTEATNKEKLEQTLNSLRFSN